MNACLKTQQTGSTQNEKIQLLRGAAILAVVIIHSALPNPASVFIRPFVNFSVALFVFLSGYLTKADIPDKKAFFIKRIQRVIVPYVVWSVIYAITQGFDGFLFNFLTGRCCDIYYYIFVYVQFVLLTPLILRLLKSKYRWIGWLITPISTMIFRYLFNYLGISMPVYDFKYLFVAWFIYYYLGLSLGNNTVTVKGHVRKYIIVYAAAIEISVAEGLFWYYRGNLDMATTQLRLSSIGTSLSFLLLCYVFIRKRRTMNSAISKILIHLGNYSFGIYLSHILIKQILFIVVGEYMIFPIDTVFILGISAGCVIIGRRILGKHGWILGL